MYRKNELLNPKPINEKKEITLPKKQGDSDFEPDWNFGEEDADWDFDSDSKDTGVIKPPAETKPIVEYFDTTEYVMNRLKKINSFQKEFEKNQTLSDLYEADLCELLHLITCIEISLRNNMVTESPNVNNKKKLKKYMEIRPIEISKPDNAIIRVTLPPLVPRQYKGAYNVYWDVKKAFELYKDEHELERIEDGKVLLIYKKYSRSLVSGYGCDNDNFEMKRVTNAISEAFNYPDTAKNFSFHYTTVKAEKNYVEATLIRMENLEFFIKYLTEN